MRIACLFLCAVGLVACGSGKRSFEAPVELNGQTVAPEVLNRGELVYMQHGRGCHGQRGRGDGPYARSLRPPPRDLTTGEYRHLESPPTDAALRAVITQGIEGTGMRAQRVEGESLTAVVAYTRWLALPDQRVQ